MEWKITIFLRKCKQKIHKVNRKYFVFCFQNIEQSNLFFCFSLPFYVSIYCPDFMGTLNTGFAQPLNPWEWLGSDFSSIMMTQSKVCPYSIDQSNLLFCFSLPFTFLLTELFLFLGKFILIICNIKQGAWNTVTSRCSHF